MALGILERDSPGKGAFDTYRTSRYTAFVNHLVDILVSFALENSLDNLCRFSDFINFIFLFIYSYGIGRYFLAL